jgi:PHD/YefM family antitoxin component YafN of YafNO toxin-antitoxin module
MITMSSREFNHDIGKAKRTSHINLMIITEHGKPTHVLLSDEEYQQMLNTQPKITNLLSLAADVDFEPTKIVIQSKTS